MLQVHPKLIDGFSKLSKEGKVKWVTERFSKNPEQSVEIFRRFDLADESTQAVLDSISENTISNYVLPFGAAPNFVVNGHVYCLPMVTEESSVVAAASSAAKYWSIRGGFHTQVISTIKNGHIHLFWYGDGHDLQKFFWRRKPELFQKIQPLIANMQRRGGGVVNIDIVDCTSRLDHYYQVSVEFETCDSMGANFINSVLESISSEVEALLASDQELNSDDLEIVMSILSNYTPNCLVKCWVECPVHVLTDSIEQGEVKSLAEKFRKAVKIAQVDPSRAATHNKGIFNGIDSVLIATGNDFRAVEASCHAYAARDGQYRGLSNCTIEDDIFRFWLEIPIAVGTVGGLTAIHPIAKQSLEMLGNPGADDLMQIVAAAGLAQNFAALRSLITTGIQKGHMKMHLKNILRALEASDEEVSAAELYFKHKIVSYSAVRTFVHSLKKQKV